MGPEYVSSQVMMHHDAMVFNAAVRARSRITRTTGQDEDRGGSCVRNAIPIATIAS